MSMDVYTPVWPKPRWDFQYYREGGIGKTGYLLKLVKDAVDWESFVGILIFGREGSGKTMFGLKLMRAIYGSWKTALSLFFYRWQDVESALDSINRAGMVYPAVFWDDMGVYAGRYKHRTDTKELERIAELVQLIREHSRCLIGTAPNPDDVAHVIRDRTGWIKCHLIRVARWKSYYVCAKYEYDFKKERNRPAEYIEGTLDIRVPDEVYIEAKARRRKYYSVRKAERVERGR